MEDYTKLKNPELEGLLKARGLPHAKLKKADMVARLQEDDAKKSKTEAASTTTAKPAATTSAEDEIDWDDDAADAPKPEAASSEPAKAAMAAGGQGRVANPVAVPNQVSTDENKPVKTDAKAPAPAAAAKATANGEAESAEKTIGEETEEKPKEKTPVDFSSGIEKVSLEAELEKRKERAKKYGIQTEDSTTEAQKRLERAKRFGGDAATEDGLPKALNEALPERRPRKRGRGENDVGGRGNFKRRGGGFRRGGFRGDRRNRRERTPHKEGGQNQGWMNEADKAKAEARKARFAAPKAAE